MIGGRSGNRGRCAQPCRMPYQVERIDGKKVTAPGEYLLSPKDICTLESIPDLMEIGVDSFKIEGRMKRFEYAAGVTAIYKKVIDRCVITSYSIHYTKLYEGEAMEKIYKTMKSAGIWNLVVGIISIIMGCFIGVCMIANGARLLMKKKELLF